MMITRPLAWLLARANARTGKAHSWFYPLKDRTLRRFGRRAGEDVQRIVDPCWGDRDTGCGPACTRCRGTGVWDSKLILLERWELGGRIFHRPDRRVYGDGWRVTVEGRIEHRDVDYGASLEAALWLAFLLEPSTWWKALRNSRRCGWQRTPMLALQVVVFEISRRAATHRCWCGKRFITWGSGWLICRACRADRYDVDTDVDLPF